VGDIDFKMMEKSVENVVTLGPMAQVTLVYIKNVKNILRQKEELWKFKYFTMQKYNLKKKPLKETKILQDIITL